MGLPDGDRLSHQHVLRAAETFPRSVMDLPDERMTADRTCAEVIRAMADPHRGTMHGPFVGITMMGPGADQIFARVVLETGGHLYVVMPTLGPSTLMLSSTHVTSGSRSSRSGHKVSLESCRRACASTLSMLKSDRDVPTDSSVLRRTSPQHVVLPVGESRRISDIPEDLRRLAGDLDVDTIGGMPPRPGRA